MTRREWLAGAAAMLPAGCVLDGELKRELDYRPVALDDGWTIGAPADVGVDPEALHALYERFFSEHEFINARSFIVVRRGVLIAEGYARDIRDRQRMQHVKSVTKSITSLVTGQALARGVLPGLDARLGDLLPQARERGGSRADITVADLLTMRSGIAWENSSETTALMVERPADSVAFTLDRRLDGPPGTLAYYKDCDPHLLGAAIARRGGASLEALAREWLFDPLGIDRLRWENGRDGVDFGAYGAWLRPRDMARLGELCRRGGEWNGRRLVDEAWLAESTRRHLDLEAGAYGYLWWDRDVLTPGAFAADGHGGQYIHVLPAQEIVCVHTALPYTPTHEAGIVIDETEELIAMLLDGLVDGR